MSALKELIDKTNWERNIVYGPFGSNVRDIYTGGHADLDEAAADLADLELVASKMTNALAEKVTELAAKDAALEAAVEALDSIYRKAEWHHEYVPESVLAVISKESREAIAKIAALKAGAK